MIYNLQPATLYFTAFGSAWDMSRSMLQSMSTRSVESNLQ